MNHFKSIALCFSGGGYRAATFSLGALSLFEKVGLLENVKAISTVSGGTITGVKYTQSQIEKKDFDTFFKEYYTFLNKNELSKNAIGHLKENAIWNTKENKHKRKNPINAFAIEYNKFTNHRTLGEIQELIYLDSKKEEGEEKNTHLKRVVFNATDFGSTQQFRFQNIKGNRRRFGNRDSHMLYKDDIDSYKLGDILASSSAFPGGFEPIGLPNDFIGKKEDVPEIGLMDGGIVDNQGSSIFVADKPDRNDSPEEILSGTKKLHDLYFVCDVASPYPGEPFKFASDSAFSRYVTIFSSVFPLIGVVLLTAFFFIKKWLLLYSIGVVFSSVFLGIQLLFLFASKKMKQETGIKESLYLPPNKIGFYIINRVKSLLRMAGVVFLKNDRRQHSSALYEAFPNKALTSTIYELRCQNETGKPEKAKNWSLIKEYTGEIPNRIKKVSEESAAFGTTLWFSGEQLENNLLDKLIACGEFTACYNLIAYLVQVHPDKIKGQDTELTSLFDNLIEEWNSFKKDPLFLVSLRKLY